jgi:hypothetical protein
MGHNRSNNHAVHRLAQGLGWFSIGLGLTELLAPRAVGRFLGMEERAELLRGYGAREIVAGVGILAQEDPTPWLWGRVGGDVLDLGTLAMGLGRSNPQRGNVAIALGAVAGVTALDVLCARSLRDDRGRSPLRLRDYGSRSGLPRSPDEMRGAARDLETPQDMRTPDAMRPYPMG